MEKEKAKEDALKGDGKAFLFMIVSILLVSLFRHNNQGVILKSASNLNGNLNCSKELEHYSS